MRHDHKTNHLLSIVYSNLIVYFCLIDICSFVSSLTSSYKSVVSPLSFVSIYNIVIWGKRELHRCDLRPVARAPGLRNLLVCNWIYVQECFSKARLVK